MFCSLFMQYHAITAICISFRFNWNYIENGILMEIYKGFSFLEFIENCLNLSGF